MPFRFVRQTTPLIQTVNYHIEQKGEVTESDIAAFLRSFDIDSGVFRPREILENLERWLTCFFPAQYETASSLSDFGLDFS